jgi:hypothetical protein
MDMRAHYYNLCSYDAIADGWSNVKMAANAEPLSYPGYSLAAIRCVSRPSVLF